jgi:hypothetical protein
MDRATLVVQEIVRIVETSNRVNGIPAYPFSGFYGDLYLPDLTVLIEPLAAVGIAATPTEYGLLLTWSKNGSTDGSPS